MVRRGTIFFDVDPASLVLDILALGEESRFRDALRRVDVDGESETLLRLMVFFASVLEDLREVGFFASESESDLLRVEGFTASSDDRRELVVLSAAPGFRRAVGLASLWVEDLRLVTLFGLSSSVLAAAILRTEEADLLGETGCLTSSEAGETDGLTGIGLAEGKG